MLADHAFHSITWHSFSSRLTVTSQPRDRHICVFSYAAELTVFTYMFLQRRNYLTRHNNLRESSDWSLVLRHSAVYLTS